MLISRRGFLSRGAWLCTRTPKRRSFLLVRRGAWLSPVGAKGAWPPWYRRSLLARAEPSPSLAPPHGVFLLPWQRPAPAVSWASGSTGRDGELCLVLSQLERCAHGGITVRPRSRLPRWTTPSAASASCKVLTTYYNLHNLNLHGNSIQSLSEVDKLAVLPHLRSLTLHGNPIEEEKGYRSYVVSTLPNLKSFDFSGVTKQDRSTANVWRRMNIKPKVVRKKRDNF
ncbi:leucine-rich repeat-containing protein 51 isoform X3 [Anolis carolinensis]|uniref:leucine-rich repeat-containing protein 51 isoform X3 n=1 Tax=Anolis carolinensis TaxID=28377 RepID=UPI002F2B51E5